MTFVSFRRIEQKERHAIYSHINSSIFQHIIEKI
jgi:hypothetical protein